MNETITNGLFAVPVKLRDACGFPIASAAPGKRTSPFISREKIAIQINQINKETFND